MASFLGKSGADAIFKATHRICIVMQKYGNKFKAAVDLTASSGLITTSDASAIKAAIDALVAVCDLIGVVAGNSSITP